MSRRSDASDDETAGSTDATTTSHATTTWKVLGELDEADAAGVIGHNRATSGTGTGVEGVTDSAADGTAGVTGRATAASGATYAVAGFNDSTGSGSGAVFGKVTASANVGYTNGVMGEDPTENGAGVYGSATGSGVTNYGVYGETLSADGYGVYSYGDSRTDGSHHVTEQVIRPATTNVYLGSNQTVSPNTVVGLGFDSTDIDELGAWDSGASEYTCPYDGTYNIDVGVTTSVITSNDYTFNVDVYGANIRQIRGRHPVPGSSDNRQFITASRTISASSGDTISVQVDHTLGKDIDIVGDSSDLGFTYMSVTYVNSTP
jgi:hypothetical protein